MTAGWLKKVLEKYDNDEAEVFIEISGTKFQLCGKVDKLFVTYSPRSNPDITLMQESLCIYPCECSDEKEDNNKADNTLLN